MLDINPVVHVVAATSIVDTGLADYLQSIGAPAWSTDAISPGEYLIEFAGRLCYSAFKPGLNPNVTRIREGNKVYIGNLLKQAHGSVLEHATITFLFQDVSRVFTHELVRHRVGVAISQESLRFVRLGGIKFWTPTAIRENQAALALFTEATEHLEQAQIKLAQLFDLDNPETEFSLKKVITSAMRRIAPDGLATNIIWTVNLRSLRGVLERRTAPDAEEEMRFVFEKVGRIAMQRYPAVFQDFTVKRVDGYDQFIAANSRI